MPELKGDTEKAKTFSIAQEFDNSTVKNVYIEILTQLGVENPEETLQTIVDNDNVFEGNCIFNSKEYNEHEYGMNEDSLQILNISFYKSYIKSVEILKELRNDEYSMLEELIVDSDKDFLDDALEMCDEVEKERLMLYIKDKNK